MEIKLEIGYRADESDLSINCDRVIYTPSEKDLSLISKYIKLCEEDENIVTLLIECTGEHELQSRTSDIEEDENDEVYEEWEDGRYYSYPLLVIGSHGICLQFSSKYSGDIFETELFNI